MEHPLVASVRQCASTVSFTDALEQFGDVTISVPYGPHTALLVGLIWLHAVAQEPTSSQ